MQLNLKRPLVFFDLETTGTNVTKDRIVEISIIKLLPGGEKIEKTRRVNPGMPIPAAATAVHHITDADVREEPKFSQLAKSLSEFIGDSDIAGFNSNRFDVPLLIEEFARAGIDFQTAGRRFVDVQAIFHKMEQRTLVAAYKFYCGKELDNAHSAIADTAATLEVLMGQLDRYPDTLKNDVDFLADFSTMNGALDLEARIVKNEAGEPIFNFGKHKGDTVKSVVRKDPSFIDWILNSEFSKNTKDVLRALRATYKAGK